MFHVSLCDWAVICVQQPCPIPNSSSNFFPSFSVTLDFFNTACKEIAIVLYYFEKSSIWNRTPQYLKIYMPLTQVTDYWIVVYLHQYMCKKCNCYLVWLWNSRWCISTVYYSITHLFVVWVTEWMILCDLSILCLSNVLCVFMSIIKNKKKASLIRFNFPKPLSDAPIHTFSKFIWYSRLFCNIPAPLFVAVYCFICGRRNMAVRKPIHATLKKQKYVVITISQLFKLKTSHS